MRRAACLVLLVLLVWPALPDAQLPTFRAGIDLVTFGVTVTDRRGTIIGDLTAADFEVVEEGRPQQVTFFARGDREESALDLHLGLLFDTSGSMGQDIDLARTAAIRFLNTLPDARDMTLVDFDSEVRLARFSQHDFPRLVERIRSRRPAGFTAMYDALAVYLDGAAEDEGRTILVMYTDGGDTRSAIGFNDLLTLIRASDVTIHTVGFLNNQSMASRMEQRSRLARIAETTGGQAFFPTTMKDVEAAYEKIVAQIRAQYTLGYTSSTPEHDGTWRRVQIRVTRPDLRGARILAREGYFAPYRESP